MSKARRTVLVPASLYRAVKYAIYLLLALNIGMFLAEEWAAGAPLLRLPLDPHALGAAFAQTIDTAAWVLLLLLFELETFVIPDTRLTPRLRWTLHGVRALCYLFILYAFYGYWALAMDLHATTAVNPADTDAGSLAAARWLAWTDVINAGTWLVIVLLLEVDVRLQLAGHLKGRVLRASEWAKGILYSTLLACALYWGFAGTFLDFWDAFLWLLAFVLIEMNVLEWQAEGEIASRNP